MLGGFQERCLKMLPTIAKLSPAFFSEHNRSGHNEILEKETRLYADGLLLTDLKNNYFVPFRSNIAKSYLDRFPEAGMKLGEGTSPRTVSGLDFRKMVIVSNMDVKLFEPIDNPSLRKNELEQLASRVDEFYKKSEDFISGYKEFVQLGYPPRLKAKYQYTSLQYFHEELGIDQEKRNKQKPAKSINEGRQIKVSEENKLTSMMKRKYGVTKSSSITFTGKENLYGAFRKLADNIYKNGDWSEEDEKRAVETFVRNYKGFEVGNNGSDGVTFEITKATPEEMTMLEQRRALVLSKGTPKVYKTLITQNKDGKVKQSINYLMLDQDNKSGTMQRKSWYLEHGPNVAVPSTVSLGNLNRTIGYDKLERDVMKEFYAQKDVLKEKNIRAEDVQEKLEELTSSNYSGKKYDFLFTNRSGAFGYITDEELATYSRKVDYGITLVPKPANEVTNPTDPYDHYNLVVDPDKMYNQPVPDLHDIDLSKAAYVIPGKSGFVTLNVKPEAIEDNRKHANIMEFFNGYIENTYDIILQQEYEKSIDKLTRASAWQTKKNINKATQEMMDNTPLKKDFSFVELDNDVDLKLFDQFENEMQRLNGILPKADSKPTLRLRKLGNYRAYGLYHAASNTIAVDFRNGSEGEDGLAKVEIEGGIQSFIHEYGHFLDYRTISADGLSTGQMLSMKPEFKDIVTGYRRNLNNLSSKSEVRKKVGYYGTPTEVFARAFEVYTSNAGLKSSFIKSPQRYELSEEYQAFDEGLRKKVTAYFDKQFPEYKKNISLLNERNEEVNKQETRTENETITQVKPDVTPNQKPQSFAADNQKEELTPGTDQDKTKGQEPRENKVESINQNAGRHKTMDELKEFAKGRDILDVANALGMDLNKESRTYRWTEHDSLVVFPKTNTYKWFSKDKQGDVISLVQNIKRVSYKEAISFLNDPNLQKADPTMFSQPAKPFEYRLRDHNSIEHAKNYLMNERGLSEETIEFFKKQGVLAEATRYHKDTQTNEPVVVFKAFDPISKKQVGATLQGIDEDWVRYPKKGHLKEIIANSEGGKGLSVDVGTPKKIIFFESSIDLMSYYELKNGKGELGDSRLVSMDGLKNITVANYIHDTFVPKSPAPKDEAFTKEFDDNLSHFQNPKETLEKAGFGIVLAVDNDDGGHNFAKNFESLANLPVTTDYPPANQPGVKMDWNDYLKQEKVSQKQTELRVQEDKAKQAQTIAAQHKNVEKEVGPKESFRLTISSIPTFANLKEMNQEQRGFDKKELLPAPEIAKDLFDKYDKLYSSYEELQEGMDQVRKEVVQRKIPNVLIEATAAEEMNHPGKLEEYDYWALGTDGKGNDVYYYGEDFSKDNYVKQDNAITKEKQVDQAMKDVKPNSNKHSKKEKSVSPADFIASLPLKDRQLDEETGEPGEWETNSIGEALAGCDYGVMDGESYRKYEVDSDTSAFEDLPFDYHSLTEDSIVVYDFQDVNNPIYVGKDMKKALSEIQDLPPFNDSTQEWERKWNEEEWDQAVESYQSQNPDRDIIKQENPIESQMEDQTPEKVAFNYEKASVKELANHANQVLKDHISNSDKLKDYLEYSAANPNLSPANVALVQEQWPNAEFAATFKKWQAIGQTLDVKPEDVHTTERTIINKRTGQHKTVKINNLSVKAGEHAKIRLVQPEMKAIIPMYKENGQPVVNSAGKPAYKSYSHATPSEKQQVKAGKLKKVFIPSQDEDGSPKYREYKVFEISQTTLKNEAYNKVVPDLKLNKGTDPKSEKIRIDKVIDGLSDYAKEVKVPIYIANSEADLNGKKGIFKQEDQKVLLSKDNTNLDNVVSIIKGLGEATLNNEQQKMKLWPANEPEMTPSRKQTEAEMASYLVAKRYGLEDKVPSNLNKWSKDLESLSQKELERSMKRINVTQKAMTKSIESHTKPLNKMMKQQHAQQVQHGKGLSR